LGGEEPERSQRNYNEAPSIIVDNSCFSRQN